MRRIFLAFAVFSSLPLAGCEDAGPKPYDEAVSDLGKERIGSDSDQWIEMLNIAGQWERTGLVFGYADDRQECENAIAGLKKVNYSREYRCTRAN